MALRRYRYLKKILNSTNAYSRTTSLVGSCITICGPGSAVGIATGYGLDSLGIKSQWRRDFLHLSRPALAPPPAFCTMGTGSFPGVKSGWCVTLTPHPLPVPWSRKSRAIPLLPLWAVRPVQSAVQVHHNFTYTQKNYSDKSHALQYSFLPYS